jgi:hypothetical protein
MSTVIAMAYAQYVPVMHLSNSAQHLEEIRRVTSRLSELITESERSRLDLQMLFGVHVFSRAKVVPDLAISRGEEAHRAARLQGDRAIEFLAAGGVAMALLELGDVDGARRWIAWRQRPRPWPRPRTRSRQLETWRGIAQGGCRRCGRHASAPRARSALATESGHASARCEPWRALAIEAARIVGKRYLRWFGRWLGARWRARPGAHRGSWSVRRPR